MNVILEEIKKQKDKSEFDAKTHFNAADRKKMYHHMLGAGAIIFTFIFLLLNGCVKFADIFGESDWIPLFNLSLLLLLIIFSGIQYFFKYMPISIAHQEIADNFWDCSKKYDHLIAAHKNNILESKKLYEQFDKLSEKHERITKKSKEFSLNDSDKQKAIQGIQDNENKYTDTERSKHESHIVQVLKERQVDALFEEKKHENAEYRKKIIDSYLPKTAIFIFCVAFILLFLDNFQLITILQNSDWIKWFLVWLIFIAAILKIIQTYLNFLPLISGHNRMAEKFLRRRKKYERLIAGYESENLTIIELYEKLEECYDKHSELLKDGHAFPTNNADYRKAQKIIRD